MRRKMPRRPPDKLRLKTATATAVAAVGLLALLVAIALTWTSTLLEQSIAKVVRDTQSSATATELSVSLLTYQRLSNLHVLTRDPEIGADREALEHDMQRLLEAARETIGSDEEQQLLESISQSLGVYLAERASLESQGLGIDSLLRATQPTFDATLSQVEALRDLNDAQVSAAHAEALGINETANVAGGVAGGILVLGLLAFVLSTRRLLLYPLLGLHATISRFRDGEHGTRAERQQLKEIDDLARNFNEMADALDAQRESQLAFLAGVAHDLRNPLQALKLGVLSLAREESGRRRDQLREPLDRAVNRLSRMIEDLLDATRIEAGHLEMQPEAIDLRECVRDVVHLYSPTTSHRIALQLPVEPVTVEADPVRIEQIIGNLLSNAIKYSPRSGAISITVATESNVALLSVRDWGIGIPEDELHNIFLPFRRRKAHSVRGAGLGLSVVRRIVLAHEGEITVSSEPGYGSTFQVSLPLTEPASAKRPGSRASSPAAA